MQTPARALGNLFSFMLVFGIRAFEIIESRPELVRARVWLPDQAAPEWDSPEDEWQTIEWDVAEGDAVNDAIELACALRDRGLVKGDRILVPADDLAERIGWDEARCEAAVSALLDIRVEMIDDGERTDFFFLHF